MNIFEEIKKDKSSKAQNVKELVQKAQTNTKKIVSPTTTTGAKVQQPKTNTTQVSMVKTGSTPTLVNNTKNVVQKISSTPTIQVNPITPVKKDWNVGNNKISQTIDTAKSGAKFLNALLDVTVKTTGKRAITRGTDYSTNPTVNKLLEFKNKADDIIKSNIHNQQLLNQVFNSKTNTDEIKNKLQTDNDYRTKMVNRDGSLVDYSNAISDLESKMKNAKNREEAQGYKQEIENMKSLKRDQETLMNSFTYDYMVKNGASDDELEQFKIQVVSGNGDNFGERLGQNLGSTFVSYAGNLNKGIDTLASQMWEMLGVDYKMSETPDALIDDANRLMALSFNNASDVEKFVYEAYDGMAPYLYSFAMFGGGQDFIRNPQLAVQANEEALLTSSVQTLGSKYKENIENGYDNDTAFKNAVCHGALSYLTEKIGGDKLADILTGEISEKMLEKGWAYIIKAAANDFVSEATEEGMEAIAEPLIDNYFTGGLTVEQYFDQVLSKDTLHQMFIGGVGGAFMGGFAGANAELNYQAQQEYRQQALNGAEEMKIETKRQLNETIAFNEDIEKMMEIANKNISDRQASGEDTFMAQSEYDYWNALHDIYKRKIAEYNENHLYADAFHSEADEVISTDNEKETIYDASIPDLKKKQEDIGQTLDSLENDALEVANQVQEETTQQAESEMPVIDENTPSIDTEIEQTQQDQVNIPTEENAQEKHTIDDIKQDQEYSLKKSSHSDYTSNYNWYTSYDLKFDNGDRISLSRDDVVRLFGEDVAQALDDKWENAEHKSKIKFKKFNAINDYQTNINQNVDTQTETKTEIPTDRYEAYTQFNLNQPNFYDYTVESDGYILSYIEDNALTGETAHYNALKDGTLTQLNREEAVNQFGQDVINEVDNKYNLYINDFNKWYSELKNWQQENETEDNIRRFNKLEDVRQEYDEKQLTPEEQIQVDNAVIQDVLGNTKEAQNILDNATTEQANNDIQSEMQRQAEENINQIISKKSLDAEAINQIGSIGGMTSEQLDMAERNSEKAMTSDDARNSSQQVKNDFVKREQKKAKKSLVSEIERKFVDRYKPITDLKSKVLNTYLDWFLTSSSRAAAFMYNGITVDQNALLEAIQSGDMVKAKDSLKNVTSAYDLFHLVKDEDKSDFNLYMYHRLNTDAAKLGKNVFAEFSSQQSQQVVDDFDAQHPEWKGYADKYYEYFNYLLEERVKAGMITEDMAKKWKEMYPNYIPVKRIYTDTTMEDNTTLDDQIVSSSKGTMHKRKGGNQDLKSLEQATLEYTQQIFKSISFNQFAQKYRSETLSSAEIFENEQDLDTIIDGGSYLQAPDNNIPAAMVYYVNGERQVMKIPVEVYNAFMVSDAPQIDQKFQKIDDVIKAVNEYRRNLLTGWNPTFCLNNGIKDFQDILFNSKHPLKTYMNYGRAMYEIFSNSKIAQLFKKVGLMDQNAGSIARLYNQVGGEYNTVSSETGLKNHNKFYNYTIGLFVDINNAIEMAPRLAEFITSIQEGASIEEALYDANEVTTNFKRGGDYAKFLDKHGFTFLNASIQGFDKQIRNIKDAYYSKGWLGVTGYMAKAAIGSGIPLLILNGLLHRDDKDYEELSDYIKENYYVLWKTKNGRFVRIPKGRIASAYQRVLTNMYNNITTLGDSEKTAIEKAQAEWENCLKTFKGVWGDIGVNNQFENNILAPVYQTLTNKSWYGEEIVPEWMDETLDPKNQYNESTDYLSRWIGKQLNISPMKINYLIDQYSGGVGDVLLPYITPKATSDLDTGGVTGKLKKFLSPMYDKFTTDPVFKNQSVNDFYSIYDEIEGKSKKESATPEDKIQYKYLNSTKKVLSDYYSQIREICNSDKTDSEKYNEARKIKEKINETSKYALDTYDNIDNSGNYYEVNGISMYKNEKGEYQTIDEETSEELNKLNMTTDQKNTYFNIKEEITQTNKVKTLLGYYDKKEEILNDKKMTNSMKQKKLKDVEDKISAAESKFTPEELQSIKDKGSIDAREINFDTINNSNLTDEQKNYIYDNYYSNNTNEYINDLEVDDKTKLEAKYKVATASGIKDENGKTISNSKALAVADIYADMGILDDVFSYIKATGISPSSMGLSNTVYNYSYNQLANAYEKMYGETFGTGESLDLDSGTPTKSRGGSSSRGRSGSSRSSSDKQLKSLYKAMSSFYKSLDDTDNVFTLLKQLDSLEDAKSKVQKALKKIKVG